MIKLSVAVLALVLVQSLSAISQVPYSEEQFRVYDVNGNASSIEQVIKALDTTDASSWAKSMMTLSRTRSRPRYSNGPSLNISRNGKWRCRLRCSSGTCRSS